MPTVGGKVPKKDLGAKVVDKDVPKMLLFDVMLEAVPNDPNPRTLPALETAPKALVGLKALANSPPVTEADEPPAEVRIVEFD